MGRPQSTEGGRPIVVPVRLSEEEFALLQAERNGYSISVHIRHRLFGKGFEEQKHK